MQAQFDLMSSFNHLAAVVPGMTFLHAPKPLPHVSLSGKPPLRDSPVSCFVSVDRIDRACFIPLFLDIPHGAKPVHSRRKSNFFIAECKNCRFLPSNHGKRKSSQIVFPCIYWLFSRFSLAEGCGIAIALVWVGQRDTRWLTPLTVSVVTRVRKVTTNYKALQAIPRL